MQKINVKGKNLEVTGALKDYVVKRTKKFEKYFESDIDIQAALAVEKEKHISEIMLQVQGILLRGEAKTDDMYASIDAAVEKIETQIKKYKTKINRRLRAVDGKLNGKAAGLTEDFMNQEGQSEVKPKIIRMKKFPVKPMTVDEAIMEMDLIGHDFFVFVSSETEDINVVYRRKDGNYGLIETQY